MRESVIAELKLARKEIKEVLKMEE